MVDSGFRIQVSGCVETQNFASLQRTFSKHRGFHQFADNMPDHDVAFLDAGGIFGGYIQQDVGEIFHRPAGCAGHGDDLNAHLLGRFEGFEDVFGIAGGGDAHDDIAGFGSAPQESREDEVIAIVVAHGGEVGGVAVKGLGVERRPIEVETAGKFRSEVLGIGRAAAVAAEMDLAAIAQRFGNHLRRLLDAGLEVGVVEDRLFGGDAVGYRLGNSRIYHNHRNG